MRPTPLVVMLHARHGPRLLHALPPSYQYDGPGTRAPALCGAFVDVYWLDQEPMYGGFLGLIDMDRRLYATPWARATRRRRRTPPPYRSGRARARSRKPALSVCRPCRRRVRAMTHPRWHPPTAVGPRPIP